jgi:hypothetical protein
MGKRRVHSLRANITNPVCRFLQNHASVVVGQTLTSAVGLIVKTNNLILPTLIWTLCINSVQNSS